jgi:hypothetical protein
MSVWQTVALVAVSLLLLVLIVLVSTRTYNRIRVAGRRRKFELKVIDSQIAKINQDPDAAPEAIKDLRLLRVVPAAPTAPPPPDGAMSVMRQLTTFPEGAGIAQLGYRIFKWLLALALVMTICLVIYGWVTYPGEDEVAAAVGTQNTAEARTNAYTQLLAAWQQQLKDLGQLFLLTPVFPLIGTVIGYIFGVRKNADPDPNTGGGGTAVQAKPLTKPRRRVPRVR